MTDDNLVLIKNCLAKSAIAIDSSSLLIRSKDIDAAFNRIYYSIFYSVLALGYKYNFITSKHRQLMGWFNRKFINEEKIFNNRMYNIYKTAYENRQDSDYNLLSLSDKTLDEAEKSLNDAVYFVKQISEFLDVG